LAAPSYFLLNRKKETEHTIVTRHVLLGHKLLPAISKVSGNNFVFQQDSARAHRANATVELLR